MHRRWRFAVNIRTTFFKSPIACPSSSTHICLSARGMTVCYRIKRVIILCRHSLGFTVVINWLYNWAECALWSKAGNVKLIFKLKFCGGSMKISGIGGKSWYPGTCSIVSFTWGELPTSTRNCRSLETPFGKMDLPLWPDRLIWYSKVGSVPTKGYSASIFAIRSALSLLLIPWCIVHLPPWRV